MDNSTSRGTDLIGTGLEARSPGKRPCSVAQAALTKYRRRCGLNNRNVFSHNYEGYKSWSPDQGVGSVDFSEALSLAIFPGRLHMAFPLCLSVSRHPLRVPTSVMLDQGALMWPHLHELPLWRPSLRIWLHSEALGVWLHVQIFWGGGDTIQSITEAITVILLKDAEVVH